DPMKTLILLIASLISALSLPLASVAARQSGQATSSPIEPTVQAAVSEHWQSSVTSKTVSGPFFAWFRSHCDLDYLGEPVTELQWDSSGVLSQSFGRGKLE